MTNKNSEKLPAYICTNCAEELRDKSKKYEGGYGCTMHQNICPRCGKEGMLATPADFGLEKINNENWD